MEIVTPEALMFGIFTVPSKLEPSSVTEPWVCKPAAETSPVPWPKEIVIVLLAVTNPRPTLAEFVVEVDAAPSKVNFCTSMESALKFCLVPVVTTRPLAVIASKNKKPSDAAPAIVKSEEILVI